MTIFLDTFEKGQVSRKNVFLKHIINVMHIMCASFLVHFEPEFYCTWISKSAKMYPQRLSLVEEFCTVKNPVYESILFTSLLFAFLPYTYTTLTVDQLLFCVFVSQHYPLAIHTVVANSTYST